MTKVIKFWKKFSFWNKLKAVITTFGAGGEITLVVTDQDMVWHGVTIAATVLGVLITQLIQDNNNDGIVDIFEK